MVIAYIGIGSNLNNPLQQVKLSLAALAKIPQTEVIKVSSLYCTYPWGVAEQPLYINAVAALKTTLLPLDLLKQLWIIENQQGRVRVSHERFGPRTLDLDILVYGDLCLTTETLVVPHPRIVERDFVLYPLAEIAPTLNLPGNFAGNVTELRNICATQGIYRLETCYEPNEKLICCE